VTATGLAPVIIVVPTAIPTLTGTTVTRSNDQLTVVIDGYSNTREVSQAVFTFTAAAGATLSTSEVTTLLGGWSGAAESVTYGSAFKYADIQRERCGDERGLGNSNAHQLGGSVRVARGAFAN
jgi:hypothetical protein